MKHPFKRTMAACLAVTLALTPLAHASEALGSELRDQTAKVAQGITVTERSLWSAAYSDLRTEHYIEYEPGGTVSAAVTYGSYLRSRATLSSMAAGLEAEGLRVAAGINAGFFNTVNGTPIGLVVADGVLCSANPNYYSVGFRADGTVIMGEPTVTLTASWTEVSALWEEFDQSITLSGFNKMREASGYFLFSDAFSATTLNSTEGTDVILRPMEKPDGTGMDFYIPNTIGVCDTLECEVMEVRPSLEERSIPEGCFVLSLADSAPEDQKTRLNGMVPGTVVTLQSDIDEGWEDVVQAVSGLYRLVEDGAVGTELPSGANPYTAVGLRADGSVVFYTVDGRQKGYSVGASYRQVASRMIELGCVTAIALDGGGSTTLGAHYADEERFRVINRPSEGEERAVSTGLFLVTDGVPSEILGDFRIVPEHDVVLAGSTVGFRVTSVDTNGCAMHWNGNLKLLSDAGTIGFEEGMLRYTAPLTAGTDAIRVVSDAVSGCANMLVVDTLSRLAVQREADGAQASELILRPGEVVELSMAATYYNLPVACGDTDFAWSVDNAVVSVDGQGTVTAGTCNGSAVLTVSGGGQSLSLPITVTGGDPFSDISGHWAYDYIADLAELGITNGIDNGDGTYSFAPNGKISRGELLTLVVRMLGVDTAQFDAVELPFADAGEIRSWMLPYVRAAYGLGLLQGKEVDGVLYAGVTDRVSRETAMVILGRTLGYEIETDLSAFEDGAAVSKWAEDYVGTLVALGIIGGSNGKLNPTGSVLRGEVAKMITLILSLPPAEQETEPPAEETPTEETPVEEVPTEEVPAEEATEETAAEETDADGAQTE